MKKILFAVLALTLPILAHASTEEAGAPLLETIRNMTLRCVVQPYSITEDGTKAYLPLRSLCSQLREGKGGAIIRINKVRYRAILVESDNSDNGDIDHLIILNTDGEVVAEHRNIPAFNNIFIALAGGQRYFREIRN